MVAQQVLVLFVVVRIRLGQLGNEKIKTVIAQSIMMKQSLFSCPLPTNHPAILPHS